MWFTDMLTPSLLNRVNHPIAFSRRLSSEEDKVLSPPVKTEKPIIISIPIVMENVNDDFI